MPRNRHDADAKQHIALKLLEYGVAESCTWMDKDVTKMSKLTIDVCKYNFKAHEEACALASKLEEPLPHVAKASVGPDTENAPGANRDDMAQLEALITRSELCEEERSRFNLFLINNPAKKPLRLHPFRNTLCEIILGDTCEKVPLADIIQRVAKGQKRDRER